ncbi:MAG: D-alanyl-D-alanine carboxypeptidase [Kiritimatiellae bacterium]|nr:D-alanyl-D-alanine carboxypeptidase [Kiritimatiellia bacterium]
MMRKLLMASMMAVLGAGVWGAPKQPVKKAAPAKKAAVAKKPVRPAAKKAPAAAPAAPVQTPYRKTPYVGAIAADARTGQILFRDRADAVARPASVTKLMTALLVLEDVAAGKYKLTTEVSAGPMALRQEPSIIGFQNPKTKEPITRSVDTLLYALMIRSANDAAVALAEYASGSLDAFVTRMNARAAQLGMTKTKYHNPNGLPPNATKRYPWKEYNTTTCEDQLKLAIEIMRRHPEITKYTSCKTWVMPDGLKIINHNNVMRMDKYKIINPDGTEALDGLKTGYIDAGGSSVVLTGKRDGKRAIVVVLGSATAKERDTNARAIMVRALEKLAGNAPAAPAPAAAPVQAAATPAAPAAPSAAVADAPKPVTPEPAKPAVAAAKETPPAAPAPVAAAPAAPQPEAKGMGGLAFGVGLLVGAGVVAGAAYGAWRWLGKDDRERWDFEDVADPSQSA